MKTLFLLAVACILSISLGTNFATYTYKQVDNVDILLDVYTPTTIPPSGKYSILFCIHGGGDIHGHKFMAFNSQELNEALNRSWVVVSIDYRLIPGAFLPDIMQDVQDAYDWVHTELPKIVPVDLSHITVFGKSAGGGLSTMSGYLLTPRPSAVIAFFPFCTNWTDPCSYKPETPVNQILVNVAKILSQTVTEYNSTGTLDPRDTLWNAALQMGKMGWLMVTHDPDMPIDQVMAQLKKFSASEHVDKNYPPTYLAHGLNDTLVPYSQSVQMANSLKANGIDYTLDLVPNANHDFDLNASDDMWLNHVLPAFQFVQNYMGNQTHSNIIKFLSTI